MTKLAKAHWDELHMFHTLMQNAYLHEDMQQFKVLIDTFSDYLNLYKEPTVVKPRKNYDLE